MEQAFEALANGELELARKLTHRGIALGDVNPRLWFDHGVILDRLGDSEEAGEAFRHAIALAPTYGQAFDELARLQAQAGKIVQAERLQARAVELLPGDTRAGQVLDSYRALLAERNLRPNEPARDDTTSPAAIEFSERTRQYDWDAIADQLQARGMALLPGFLSETECDSVIRLWDDIDRFEHEVDLDGDTGRVTYRFFTRPLPELVSETRVEVYARLAPIANAWNEAVHRTERFPAELGDFLARCHGAGQTRTTPILLRYPPHGWNAPHRDIAGRVVFPFQLAIPLGPGTTDSGGGGELVLVDARPGRRVHERRLGTAAGDAVVFCTRERPVKIAGIIGLQPVLHGVSEIGDRERFALGIPFHEHG